MSDGCRAPKWARITFRPHLGGPQALEPGIHEENNVLFPMSDRLLTDQIDAELFRLYEQVEESHGHGVHCEQTAFADEAEKRFLAS